MPDTRIPPQNIECEQSVLGAIIQHNEALHIAMARLDRSDFYLPKHGNIFQAARKLYRVSSAVDLVTLSAELSDRDQLTEVGGRRYLMDLTDSVVTFCNIEEHIDLVKEAARKNRLINFYSESINKLYNPETTSEQIISEGSGELISMSSDLSKIEISDPAKDAEEFGEYLETPHIGIETGFSRLDKLTLGFQNGYYIIVAATPGIGKTAYALNVINHVAIKNKKHTLFVSLEMNKPSLLSRLASSTKNISTYKMRECKLDDPELVKMSQFMGEYSVGALHIVDTPTVNHDQLNALVHQAVLKYNIELVVLDHVGLMSGASKEYDRNSENSLAIREMKRRYNIPFLILCQLNREVDGGPPKLKHLRGSGRFEQDADQVIFIHNELDDNNLPKEEGTFIFAKGRNEQTGAVGFRFDGRHGLFYEIERRYEDANHKSRRKGNRNESSADSEPPIF